MDTNTKRWGINDYKLVNQTPWQKDDSGSAYIIAHRTQIRINEQNALDLQLIRERLKTTMLDRSEEGKVNA